jgi:hypothetical protein
LSAATSFLTTAVVRVVGLFTMLAGIAAASIITGKFAEFLLRSGREDAATEAAQQAVTITRP